jgi:hypothetical protein
MRFKEIITELQGIKRIKPENISPKNELYNDNQNLIDFMNNYGFRVIGEFGMFSTVFAYKTNPNLVVKIFDIKEDKGFLLFIRFCKENPGNPFLPVFKGNSIKISENIRMIRIERLYKLKPRDWVPLQKMISYVNERLVPPEIVARLASLEDKELYNTLVKLRAFAGHCTFDIHSNNVMKRKNGQIVIIDPFAFGSF